MGLEVVRLTYISGEGERSRLPGMFVIYMVLHF